MIKPLFLQIHTLTSYAGALINRDDAGFAKRLPFGGVTRTRISSQCLKRHYRTFQGEEGLGNLGKSGEPVTFAVRSRHSFERFVLAPLLADGVAPDLARTAAEAVMVAVLGESQKGKKTKAETKGDDGGSTSKKRPAKENGEASAPSLISGQITVLGKPELDFFLAEARFLAAEAGTPDRIDVVKKKRFTKEWGKNLEGLKRAAGLDAALFGRMVTSDKLSRADAAVHVAHAFTVHAEHTEADYFSAVDDLLGTGGADAQLGSGHLGTAELTSGLYYGYVVIDVPQLVSNLEGCDPSAWMDADRALAADVAATLVNVVSRVSPGAKKGSTAPYSYAHLTLVEAGSSQPRTLANAFLKPVTEHADLLVSTYGALASYLADVDAVYDLKNRRALAAIGPKDAIAAIAVPKTLSEAALFAARSIVEFR